MVKFFVILFPINFLFSSEFSNVNANNSEIFSSYEHCVAYTTPEKILFFPYYQVVAKSCEVDASAEHNEKQSRFIIKIPIDSFDSGISSRDEDVKQILKDDIYWIKGIWTSIEVYPWIQAF